MKRSCQDWKTSAFERNPMDIVIAILLLLILVAILWIFAPDLFFNLLELAKFLTALMFVALLFSPVVVRMVNEIMETSAKHDLAEQAVTADTEQGFLYFLGHVFIWGALGLILYWIIRKSNKPSDEKRKSDSEKKRPTGIMYLPSIKKQRDQGSSKNQSS